MNILELVPLAKDIINRIIPDPDKAMELQLELAKVEVQESTARMGVLQSWLANPNWFVSGAIPMILWMISLVVFFNHVFGPMLKGLGMSGLPLLDLPEWYYGLAKLIIGGLFLKKVVDDNELRYPNGTLLSPAKKAVTAALMRGDGKVVTSTEKVEVNYEEKLRKLSGKDKEER